MEISGFAPPETVISPAWFLLGEKLSDQPALQIHRIGDRSRKPRRLETGRQAAQPREAER
jgi:hypothetical protein